MCAKPGSFLILHVRFIVRLRSCHGYVRIQVLDMALAPVAVSGIVTSLLRLLAIRTVRFKIRHHFSIVTTVPHMVVLLVRD